MSEITYRRLGWMGRGLQTLCEENRRHGDISVCSAETDSAISLSYCYRYRFSDGYSPCFRQLQRVIYNDDNICSIISGGTFTATQPFIVDVARRVVRVCRFTFPDGHTVTLTSYLISSTVIRVWQTLAEKIGLIDLHFGFWAWRGRALFFLNTFSTKISCSDHWLREWFPVVICKIIYQNNRHYVLF